MMDLQELIEDAGYETRSYSGRCMYGKECLAVVTDESLAAVICSVIREALDYDEVERHELANFVEELSSAREDAMGMSYVYYWPNQPYQP